MLTQRFGLWVYAERYYAILPLSTHQIENFFRKLLFTIQNKCDCYVSPFSSVISIYIQSYLFVFAYTLKIQILQVLLSIVSAASVASATVKSGSKTLFLDLNFNFILQTNYRHSYISENLILRLNMLHVISFPKLAPLNYVSFSQLMLKSSSVLHKLEICGHL